MLDNIIPDYAAEAYATLRRTGFVGGLSREVAAEVIELAYSDANDIPHYCRQGADNDARYCLSAQWDDMANATNHFGDDD